MAPEMRPKSLRSPAGYNRADGPGDEVDNFVEVAVCPGDNLGTKMVDEMNKKLLEVLLDRRHLFMVVIPKSKSIGDLRAEVQNVACEMFTEFRGEVSTLETKNGARLPFKYEVGEILESESGILAYSSDYKMSTNGKTKYPSSSRSEEQLSKGKRKRTKESCTTNGHVRQHKNTYNSVRTFMDKSVEYEENDGIELSVNALHSGDGELFEGERDSPNRNNDMEVDEIKRKLCFSECSGVQNTKTRSSSTTKHKSRKRTKTISREEECGKLRKIGGGEKKLNKSQRSMISHNEKDLKHDTVNGENCESAESPGSSTNVSDSKDTDKYNREGNLRHRSSYLTHKKRSEHHGNNNSNKQPGDRVKGKKHGILGCSQELKSNGKPQGTETELSQDKGTSLQTRNTVRQQEQPGSQDCALLRSFFEDKSKLQKEPESLVGRVAGKRGGNTDTMRKACDVQRQGLKKARDDGSKEPEARSASDGASVEAILSASKFRDLFSLPENCRSKRKEAIETSASKVACWLYTSNASPAIDEYVRVSTADDSDREVEVEGLPNFVGRTRETSTTPRKQAAKRIASGHNNGDDNGDCGDDSTEHADSDADSYADSDADSRNSKQITTVNSFREDIGQTKQKAILKTRPGDIDGKHSIKQSIGASQEKEVCETIPLRSIGVNRSSDKRLSTSSLGSVTQTCQVKIKRLPVYSEGGKLKIMWDSAALNLTPLHEHNGSSVANEHDGDQMMGKGRKSNPASRGRPLISPNKNTDSKNEECQEESGRMNYVSEIECHASTPTKQLRSGVKGRDTKTTEETRKAKDLEVLAMQSRDGQQDGYSSDAKTRKDQCEGDLIQVDETVETTRPNDEKERSETMKAAEASSASNNLHSITVKSSSHGQGSLRSLRPLKEVSSSRCGETGIDSDSESGEQDVVNKRTRVTAQTGADGNEHGEAPYLTEEITRKDANLKHLRIRSGCSAKQATIKNMRNESSHGDDDEEHEEEQHVTEEIAKKDANSKETLQLRIRSDCLAKQAMIKKIRNESSSGDDDEEHEEEQHVTEEIAKKDANSKETLQLRIRSDCLAKQAMIKKIRNESSSGDDDEEHEEEQHVTEEIAKKDANSKETLQLRIRSDCLAKQAMIKKIRNESSSGDDDEEHEEEQHVTEEIAKKDANSKEETLQLRISSDNSAKQARCDETENESSEKERFVVSKGDLSPLACSKHKHSPSASLHRASCDKIETRGQLRKAEGSPTKSKASNTDTLPSKEDLKLSSEGEDEAPDTDEDSSTTSEESNGKKVPTEFEASGNQISKASVSADRENKDREENGDSEPKTESTLGKRKQSNKDKLFIPESTFLETGETSGNLNDVLSNKRHTNTGMAKTLRTSRETSNPKSDGKSGKSNLKCTDWKDLGPAEQLSSGEQERHKIRSKTAENVKSQNTSQSTVEQSRNKVNSIGSEQEEYINKNKEHKHDNNGLTSNLGTLGSVNLLDSGKRKRKHSNGPAEDTSDVKGRAELANSWKPSSSQKKQSKGLLSLVDLAEEGDGDNTTVNRKALTSPRRTVQNRLRQFRQTPKGFCHTVRRRKLSASTSSVHICHSGRKPLKTSVKNFKPRNLTSKKLIELSMEQVLADDSIWDK